MRFQSAEGRSDLGRGGVHQLDRGWAGVQQRAEPFREPGLAAVEADPIVERRAPAHTDAQPERQAGFTRGPASKRRVLGVLHHFERDQIDAAGRCELGMVVCWQPGPGLTRNGAPAPENDMQADDDLHDAGSLHGEPEPWAPWESALIGWSLGLGIVGLIVFGWLVDRFILS